MQLVAEMEHAPQLDVTAVMRRLAQLNWHYALPIPHAECIANPRESRLGNAMAGIVCVRRVVFKSFEQKDVVLNRLIVFVQLIKCKT